jgi:hypothetical protein
MPHAPERATGIYIKKRLWEKAFVAQSEVLTQHLVQGIEGKHEIGHSEVPATRSRFELRTSRTRNRSATHQSKVSSV